MTERPILFSAPMVRAILEGRKTVTRRVVKPQPNMDQHGFMRWEHKGVLVTDQNTAWSPFDKGFPRAIADGLLRLCPYGQPGDRLWVRETWYCDHFEVISGPYLKPADLNVDEARSDGTLVYAADGLTPYECEQPTWKPSIHMPRWACRILLEITAVRVERLHDITEQQALAEGIDIELLSNSQERYDMVADHNMTGRPTAVGAFRDLWASINGIESWTANPWVWAVEFKRVTP